MGKTQDDDYIGIARLAAAKLSHLMPNHFDDMVSVALLAIAKSINGFDESQSTGFTYYTMKSRYAIMDYIRTGTMIRVPKEKYKDNVRRFCGSLDEMATDREVGIGELVAHLEYHSTDGFEACYRALAFVGYTEREIWILRMLVEGNNQAEISKILGVSTAYISKVYTNIRRRGQENKELLYSLLRT